MPFLWSRTILYLYLLNEQVQILLKIFDETGDKSPKFLASVRFEISAVMKISAGELLPSRESLFISSEALAWVWLTLMPVFSSNFFMISKLES